MLQRTGMFENGEAKESYSVIPGSGTGELRGFRARALRPLDTERSIRSR